MSAATNINDLPDEILEQILLSLDLDERKLALRVCRRWSALKPFDWASIKLVLKFAVYDEDKQLYCKSLLSSDRNYRHLDYEFGPEDYPETFDLFINVLRHFSRTLETLKIIMNNGEDFNLKMFSQIAALGSNLRHLSIDYCKYVDEGDQLEIAPMPKLEEINLNNNILKVIPNLKDITPNIKRVILDDYEDFEDISKFISHVSSGLVKLSIRFKSEDDFLMVYETEFPSLLKLDLSFPDDTEPDCCDLDFFIDQLPGGLEEVRLLNHELTVESVQSLCQRCSYLQFVDLTMDLEDCYLTLCELKHLKRLAFSNVYVTVPKVSCPQLKSLHCLDLKVVEVVDEVELNLFIRSHFPNLAVLKLTYVQSKSSEKFELCRIISSNIPSLQRVEVWQWDASLQEFLQFCATFALRELTFHCFNLLNEPPAENQQMTIGVQKLILNVITIKPSMLRTIVSAMNELRFLELKFQGDCTRRSVRNLEREFPRLKIKGHYWKH